MRPMVAAGLVDALPVDDACRDGRSRRTRRCTTARRRGRDALFGVQAVGVEAHDLARLHVAHVRGPHDVEPARLRGHHPAAAVGQLRRCTAAGCRGGRGTRRANRGWPAPWHRRPSMALHGVADALAQVMACPRDLADEPSLPPRCRCRRAAARPRPTSRARKAFVFTSVPLWASAISTSSMAEMCGWAASHEAAPPLVE